ncbi:sigma-54-dependent transcriptional regulator [Spartinivicinus poritis]|uniref:Sigma-54 dependent transcriptional regulator n=1 Tax=Spartinivicinus poritis TaxID=2994640 RepID=A0ABT5UK91_9GAMM|nr:sigma-54 dependent transcriptional regulator [Spartinivicinus sp. A2-2]MDE1465808.1 sigma-54 dependent transcriptional regulator [Spartinivicinus sp. A2-2]
MSVGKVLLVDDDHEICQMLSVLLGAHGYETVEVYDGHTALNFIQHNWLDAVLVDVQIPNMSGIELLKQVLYEKPDLPVIMMTGYAGVADAVAVMKAGAIDYIVKPFRHEHVIRAIRCALQVCRLGCPLEGGLQVESELHKRMGPSQTISHLAADVRRVAHTDFTVVLQGETGTGKSLLAKVIHEASPRAKQPFVVMDCGAIPETLLESELFGYEKGAFTGANRYKAGQFKLAQQGTLFLDEIGNMSLAFQMKLLCVLQEKTILPLGGNKRLPVDVRLLVASNQDLSRAVAEGTFREDLYYRLNEFSIYLPALRGRSKDILYLAENFRIESNKDTNKTVSGFSKGAENLLKNYSWPGNVRQLRMAVRRAILLSDEVITEEHIQLHSLNSKKGEVEIISLSGQYEDFSLKDIIRKNTESVERKVLTEVLELTQGNKAKAARLLQVDYKTIHTKLKKYGISHPCCAVTENKTISDIF